MRARSAAHLLALAGVLNSLVLDFQVRLRLGGLNLSFFVLNEVAALAPNSETIELLKPLVSSLSLVGPMFASESLDVGGARDMAWRSGWAVTDAQRLRISTLFNALIARLVGLERTHLDWILRKCDLDSNEIASSYADLPPTGFWRVDKDKHPELRPTVLALVAFTDLERQSSSAADAPWLLPAELRLADYNLGHGERARTAQPVASLLGPRSVDWQLAQSVEESWRECEIHASNLEKSVGPEVLATTAQGAAENRRKTKRSHEGSLLFN